MDGWKLADNMEGKATSLQKYILLMKIHQVIVVPGFKHKPQQLGKQNATRI